MKKVRIFATNYQKDFVRLVIGKCNKYIYL